LGAQVYGLAAASVTESVHVAGDPPPMPDVAPIDEEPPTADVLPAIGAPPVCTSPPLGLKPPVPNVPPLLAEPPEDSESFCTIIVAEQARITKAAAEHPNRSGMRIIIGPRLQYLESTLPMASGKSQRDATRRDATQRNATQRNLAVPSRNIEP
jgi:hypothetical protein